MEAYADYTFYKEKYEGKTIPEPAFDKLAIEASFFVNKCCFRRINDDLLNDPDLGDRIRRATCAVAEVTQKSNERDGISSEKVGDTSVTYRDTSQSATNKNMRNAAALYLEGTGLLYAGVY